ncbi:hypothetical protein A2Z33_06740 [Candidatus Gottesmanbacteria bacterium RBG_16_52_11]|uniref:SH3b domain-containing protein n=1 Tax=Candidatus Gottesmanbacteria bacterium RBG_16_52_11 TaxID=1798374 RepID=A0A1F5YXN5_9BACT|nr:MAG: hypothetical protein A2Z33_06740 [Candidatus Gottesmanbacteria bacterium RBG_16_52_11]
MRRKVIFLVALIGLVAIGVGVFRMVRTSAPKQGVLKVNSEPAASIFIDDRVIGKTPYEEHIGEGEYNVKLVPDATTTQLATWQGKVQIYGNLLTFVNASLGETDFSTAVDILWLEKTKTKNSELTVLTSPDGAAVSVDTQGAGSTPLTLSDITVGDHTVSVDSPGFLPRSLKVKTTAGYRLVASIKMAISSMSATPSAAPEASPTAEIVQSPTPTGSVKSSPTPTKKVSGTPTPTGKAAADPDKPYALIKETPTGFLRVREQPSTASRELAQVKPGEKYTILDEQSGWYQISYDGENKGWISGQYATKVE